MYAVSETAIGLLLQQCNLLYCNATLAVLPASTLPPLRNFARDTTGGSQPQAATTP